MFANIRHFFSPFPNNDGGFYFTSSSQFARHLQEIIAGNKSRTVALKNGFRAPGLKWHGCLGRQNCSYVLHWGCLLNMFLARAAALNLFLSHKFLFSSRINLVGKDFVSCAASDSHKLPACFVGSAKMSLRYSNAALVVIGKMIKTYALQTNYQIQVWILFWFNWAYSYFYKQVNPTLSANIVHTHTKKKCFAQLTV